MESIITKRQKQLLEVIYNYIKDTGYPPTFEEMRKGLNVSSNQSIIDLLEKLKNKGFIQRNESVARGISILPASYEILGKPPLVAFLGFTAAGAPLETIEITGEWQEAPGEARERRPEVAAFRAQADADEARRVAAKREWIVPTVSVAALYFAPGLAMLSAKHETQYSRLFRS